MKLAEALLHRKDLQIRIKEDQEALDAAVITPQGLGPDEEPQALLRGLEDSHAALESLITQINRTNNQAMLPSGLTLMEAIARREAQTKRLEHLKGLLKAILGRNRREFWSDNAPLHITHLSPEQLRTQINGLAKGLRELDLEIQAANWSTDLVA